MKAPKPSHHTLPSSARKRVPRQCGPFRARPDRTIRWCAPADGTHRDPLELCTLLAARGSFHSHGHWQHKARAHRIPDAIEGVLAAPRPPPSDFGSSAQRLCEAPQRGWRVAPIMESQKLSKSREPRRPSPLQIAISTPFRNRTLQSEPSMYKNSAYTLDAI